MPRTTAARADALTTAERLFRTQGYAATGLTQILEESGAPKGSFYFHFPDGKDGLAAELVAAYAESGRALIAQLGAASPDAAVFVKQLCGAFAAEMRAGDYQRGCLVQNLAVERGLSDDALGQALRAAIENWIAATAEALVRHGLAKARALGLATALVSALEGARTVARLQRSDAAFRQLADLFQRALDAHRE